MKIKCDFCKTEYNIDGVPSGPVRCAVCGHKWSVATPPRRNTWLVFFSALVALLAAVVFAGGVLYWDYVRNLNRDPLIASISDYEFINDDTGARRLVVHGFISNQTDDLYGVPDVIVVFADENGRELSEKKIMPPATWVDAGATVDFKHVFSVLPAGAKSISVKLGEVEPSTGDKK